MSICQCVLLAFSIMTFYACGFAFLARKERRRTETAEQLVLEKLLAEGDRLARTLEQQQKK